MAWTDINSISEPFNYNDFADIYENVRYLANKKDIDMPLYLEHIKQLTMQRYAITLIKATDIWYEFISTMIELVSAFGTSGFEEYPIASSLMNVFKNKGREYNRYEMETAIKYLNYCKTKIDEEEGQDAQRVNTDN